MPCCLMLYDEHGRITGDGDASDYEDATDNKNGKEKFHNDDSSENFVHFFVKNQMNIIIHISSHQ